jgi:hypothetical protein
VGPFTAVNGIKPQPERSKEKGETSMKTKVLTASMLLFVAAVAAAPSHAQQISKINIPFAFQAGGKTLPAGEYRVMRALQDTAAAQLIQSTDGKTAVVVLTDSVDPKKPDVTQKMVFHRYGREYFLSQIWTGNGLGRKLWTSKREKEAMRGLDESDVAILFEPQPLRP